MNYEKKYLKYKEKYLQLKNQIAGSGFMILDLYLKDRDERITTDYLHTFGINRYSELKEYLEMAYPKAIFLSDSDELFNIVDINSNISDNMVRLDVVDILKPDQLVEHMLTTKDYKYINRERLKFAASASGSYRVVNCSIKKFTPTDMENFYNLLLYRVGYQLKYVKEAWDTFYDMEMAKYLLNFFHEEELLTAFDDIPQLLIYSLDAFSTDENSRYFIKILFGEITDIPETFSYEPIDYTEYINFNTLPEHIKRIVIKIKNRAYSI
jgi:hypothetical protein